MVTCVTDSIASHVTHCRAAGMAYRTVHDREELLRRVDADLPCGIAEATVEELQEWLVGPQPPDQPWSAETRKTYYTHITGYFRQQKDVIGWDPSAGLVRPVVPAGLPNPISDDELA